MIHQTQSGLTYYTPQAQPQPRPSLPQRRPTNAIPILAPPDKGSATAAGAAATAGGLATSAGKGRSGRATNAPDDGDEENKNADDIDHILDNMFVRRAPITNAPSISSSNAAVSGGATRNKSEESEKSTGQKTDPSLEEGIKV